MQWELESTAPYLRILTSQETPNIKVLNECSDAETWMRESQQLQDTSKEEVRPSVDLFEDEEEVRPSVVAEAYPSFRDKMQANLSNMECGVPTQLSFSAREIADETFFKAIEDYDPDSKRLLYQIDRLYHNYPVDTLGEITFEKHLLYI